MTAENQPSFTCRKSAKKILPVKSRRQKRHRTFIGKILVRGPEGVHVHEFCVEDHIIVSNVGFPSFPVFISCYVVVISDYQYRLFCHEKV